MERWEGGEGNMDVNQARSYPSALNHILYLPNLDQLYLAHIIFTLDQSLTADNGPIKVQIIFCIAKVFLQKLKYDPVFE